MKNELFTAVVTDLFDVKHIVRKHAPNETQAYHLIAQDIPVHRTIVFYYTKDQFKEAMKSEK